MPENNTPAPVTGFALTKLGATAKLVPATVVDGKWVLDNPEPRATVVCFSPDVALLKKVASRQGMQLPE